MALAISSSSHRTAPPVRQTGDLLPRASTLPLHSLGSRRLIADRGCFLSHLPRLRRPARDLQLLQRVHRHTGVGRDGRHLDAQLHGANIAGACSCSSCCYCCCCCSCSCSSCCCCCWWWWCPCWRPCCCWCPCWRSCCSCCSSCSCHPSVFVSHSPLSSLLPPDLHPLSRSRTTSPALSGRSDPSVKRKRTRTATRARSMWRTVTAARTW